VTVRRLRGEPARADACISRGSLFAASFRNADHSADLLDSLRNDLIGDETKTTTSPFLANVSVVIDLAARQAPLHDDRQGVT
jgi:hypothetical protein